MRYSKNKAQKQEATGARRMGFLDTYDYRVLFGQGHRDQTQCLCQDRAKSPEERQEKCRGSAQGPGRPARGPPRENGNL